MEELTAVTQQERKATDTWTVRAIAKELEVDSHRNKFLEPMCTEVAQIVQRKSSIAVVTAFRRFIIGGNRWKFLPNSSTYIVFFRRICSIINPVETLWLKLLSFT